MKNAEEINYILDNIKNNDVFIVRSKIRLGIQSLFLAPLIRLFTKSKYNHAGLISLVFMEKPIVIEADEKGFRPSCYLEDWLKKQDNFIIYRNIYGNQKNVEIRWERECFDRLCEILYKPYDFANTLFYQVIHLLSKKTKWVGEKNAKRVNCSEAVAYVHGLKNYYKFLPSDFEKHQSFKVVFKVEKGKIVYKSK